MSGGGGAAEQEVGAPRPLPPHPLRALGAQPRELRVGPGRLRTAVLPAAFGALYTPPSGRSFASAQCVFPGCGSHAEPVRRGEWEGISLKGMTGHGQEMPSGKHFSPLQMNTDALS